MCVVCFLLVSFVTVWEGKKVTLREESEESDMEKGKTHIEVGKERKGRGKNAFLGCVGNTNREEKNTFVEMRPGK